MRCPQRLINFNPQGMSDGTVNTMSQYMKTDKKTTNDESEEKDVEDIEDQDESEDEESDKETDESEDGDESADDEEESEDEDESSSKKKEDLDLDAELEKERKAGEPDLTIAEKAFKDRKKKKQEESADDGDKPLTQKDLDAALARDRKDRQRDDAFSFAREMAGSEKEAELIVAKWGNRTFPKNLTLREQISEAYVITHSKKLIGERNEAMRALRGKRGVKDNAAGTHRDGDRNPNEPKLSPQDMAVMRQSGFSWNTNTRRHEKKLPNGRILFRDNRTKDVKLLPKGQK